MANLIPLLAAAALGGSSVAGSPASVRNVVIVHGAFADGSGWRGVLRSTDRAGL
jgi:hypothetical protein